MATSSANQLARAIRGLAAVVVRFASYRAPSRRIGQNLVGARRLEEGDRTVVSRDVGMIPTSQLPVRTLDLFCASARRYA